MSIGARAQIGATILGKIDCTIPRAQERCLTQPEIWDCFLEEAAFGLKNEQELPDR